MPRFFMPDSYAELTIAYPWCDSSAPPQYVCVQWLHSPRARPVFSLLSECDATLSPIIPVYAALLPETQHPPSLTHNTFPPHCCSYVHLFSPHVLTERFC